MRVKFLFIFFLLFLPLQVLAVGLSVEPAKLDINYPQEKKRQLKISNISSEPIFVKVQADDLQNNIKIEPSEFNLLPEEMILLEVAVNFSEPISAVQKTNISIISQALHQNSFKAVSGIKIPLTLQMTEISNFWKWFILAVWALVFILFIYLLWKIFIWFLHRKRRSFLDLDFLLHHKRWLFKTGRWHKLWRK